MDYLLILLLFFITMVLTAVEENQKKYYLFGKIIAIVNLVCVPLFLLAVAQSGKQEPDIADFVRGGSFKVIAAGYMAASLLFAYKNMKGQRKNDKFKKP